MDAAVIHKYCRVCTNSKTHMRSIFDHCEFSQCNLQVFEVITMCASVQIRELDGFPEQICNECLVHLRQAFTFKQLCEQSDYKFRYNLDASYEEVGKIDNGNIFNEKLDCPSSDDEYEIRSANCEEVSEIECCPNNDNMFNEELDCASSDDGFEIKNEISGDLGVAREESAKISSTSALETLTDDEVMDEINSNNGNKVNINEDQLEVKLDFHEEITKIYYGDLGVAHEESAKISSTSALETLTDDEVIDEINSNNGNEVNINEDQLEVKLDFYEEITKIDYGDLGIAHEESALTDDLSACFSQANREEIIEYGVSDIRLRDTGKSSSNSTTLQDLNNELPAKTTPVGKPQICEINLNLDQISEDTEISNNELCNEINTNISKDVGSPTKSDFIENSHLCQFFRRCLVGVEKECYKCKVCGKTYTCKAAIIRLGIRIHTGEKPYKCKICGKCFSRNGHLKEHMMIHTGEKHHKCEICYKCFSRKLSLEEHMMIHTGEKPYKCEICAKCFSRNGHLKEHMMIHTGEMPHKCEICGKCFIQKVRLKNHIMIHTGEKRHKCEICGKCFSRNGHLKEHIMMIHTGEKPYKCEICGKCFAQKVVLKTHIMIHTGEKRHKCEICGKCFSRNGHLKEHIMMIHTGEKPYKCEICGKCFIQKVRLKNHIMIHTGEKRHKCEICGKCFIHKVSLKEHMTIHTGEKPHKCEICGKCFNRKLSLKEHMMIHTGEKPHKCEICGKCFSRNGHLKNHMRIHTGEKPHNC